jgi:hypothetical protein
MVVIVRCRVATSHTLHMPSLMKGSPVQDFREKLFHSYFLEYLNSKPVCRIMKLHYVTVQFHHLSSLVWSFVTSLYNSMIYHHSYEASLRHSIIPPFIIVPMKLRYVTVKFYNLSSLVWSFVTSFLQFHDLSSLVWSFVTSQYNSTIYHHSYDASLRHCTIPPRYFVSILGPNILLCTLFCELEFVSICFENRR